MFRFIYQNKILWVIIKRISVYMMNMFKCFKITFQSFFHNRTMFKRPFSSRFCFYLPIYAITAFDFSSRSYWSGTGMINTRKRFANSFSAKLFFSAFISTFWTLFWIIKRLSILSSFFLYRITANSTRFVFKFYHNNKIYHQKGSVKCQV